MTTYPARAVIDHRAIAANIASLRDAAGDALVMAVVKSGGYGHGIEPVARTALKAGAQWLGVAQLSEALRLRAAGIEAPLLSWIFTPADPLEEALKARIDLSVSAPWALQAQARAARATGLPALVHLKVDTGMGRGGAPAAGWEGLVAEAAALQREGLIAVRGIWSHLARADEADPQPTAAQVAAFRDALRTAVRAGIEPELRHLAASSGTLLHPQTHFDLVRPGIAVYGVSPTGSSTSAELGLRPAMRLEASLTNVKDVPAGTPVSYGHTYTTTTATRLAVVPLGYGDGIPRHASGRAELLVDGRRVPLVGRVCMDQVVCDLGPAAGDVEAGATTVLFGDGSDGEPTAADWARAAGTIAYEIVTRIGPQVPRVHVGRGEGEE